MSSWKTEPHMLHAFFLYCNICLRMLALGTSLSAHKRRFKTFCINPGIPSPHHMITIGKRVRNSTMACLSAGCSRITHTPQLHERMPAGVQASSVGRAVRLCIQNRDTGSRRLLVAWKGVYMCSSSSWTRVLWDGRRCPTSTSCASSAGGRGSFFGDAQAEQQLQTSLRGRRHVHAQDGDHVDM